MALMKLRFDNLVIRQFGNTYNCFLMALRKLPCNDFKVLKLRKRDILVIRKTYHMVCKIKTKLSTYKKIKEAKRQHATTSIASLLPSAHCLLPIIIYRSNQTLP